MSECDMKGHDLRVFDASDEMIIWHCNRCGAEIWEETNE